MSSGIVDTGRQQKVYNLGGAVSGGKIIIVHRDAFGDLWVTDNGACEDIQPGSYRAIAGATIAPGEMGLILIHTCDGTTIVDDAINQTDCTFYMGNRITASVDPCCVIHFTGCGPTEPVDCCDKSVAICVNGRTQIVAMGAQSIWPILECCTDCSGGFITIRLDCVGDAVTASWASYCYSPGGSGPVVTLGTLDWSGLCDDPAIGYEDTVTIDGWDSTTCDITIVAEPELSENMCDPCGDPPPEGCCDKSLWFCINNDSREMAVDGGDETWDVSECCPDCTSATVRLQMTCSNGVISLTRTYNCDGDISIETTNISQYCSSTETAFLNIPTPNCFLQAQISIAEVPCDACDPCEADPDSCVTVDCCANPIPKTLTMVVVGGACAGTYSLVWSSGSTWQDVGYSCAAIELVCVGGVWTMSVDMIGITLTSATCDPLEIVFDGTLVGITSVTVTA
jgi:hypothetical protein